MKINSDLRAFIPSLENNELEALENSLLEQGCRDALVVWNDVLIDGHHRYDLCQKHGIEFKTHNIHFEDIDDAKIWMVENQRGRRNLSTFSRVELELKIEPILAEQAKRRQLSGLNHQDVVPENSTERGDTRDRIAENANTSNNTVSRVKKILEATDDEEELKALRSGNESINRGYANVKQKKTIEKERFSVPDKNKYFYEVTSDESVVECDAVITDPPYGILTEEWEPDDIKAFTLEWAEKWNDSGANVFCVFFAQQYLFDGKQWFDEALSNYDFQQLLVWHYPNNKKHQSRKEFKRTWEPIFLYRKKGADFDITLSAGEWGEDLTNFDCHTAAIPQSNFNDVNMKQHPAQKPLSVMRWLVNAATEKGWKISDPFCGTGTTGIAAQQLGRVFHGIEINPEYIDISRRRISRYG